MSDPEPGKRMTVAGWGATLNSSSADVLMKADVPIVSREECKKKLENVNRHVTSQHLCAGGERGKDACRGDGGGALMNIYSEDGSDSLNWVQYGIGSWGVGCGRVGYPAAYTRVASFLDWIVNVILVG
ncbi:hypothetical protein ILUMI_18541 [Ignelater luminosus]|uniref:Peptidase S1 domain-containing protein n=1 Tax=Ignelater luminosus TaxID=2038154 RepID=A0A8K0CNZ4_IGNLU|nr:hypothetical protein ILUMI_18541 [Ignelater luminosus]